MTSTVLEALIARDLLELLDAVCRARGVTREELCGRTRTKNIALARRELWWRLRRHPGMSYDEIGRLFERNRTTIMGGIALVPSRERRRGFARVDSALLLAMARARQRCYFLRGGLILASAAGARVCAVGDRCAVQKELAGRRLEDADAPDLVGIAVCAVAVSAVAHAVVPDVDARAPGPFSKRSSMN